MIGEKEKYYSPIYNWFNCNKDFPNHPKQMILKCEQPDLTKPRPGLFLYKIYANATNKFET